MVKALLKILTVVAVCLALAFISGCRGQGLSGLGIGSASRSITVDEYVDKMKAGWIGQMAGVTRPASCMIL